ncbi:MAG: hypothetical protein EXS15_02190 [Phycisphaerales bacterium]|nr:hypothetical protein [Phycisphaerales bacterium]
MTTKTTQCSAIAFACLTFATLSTLAVANDGWPQGKSSDGKSATAPLTSPLAVGGTESRAGRLPAMGNGRSDLSRLAVPGLGALSLTADSIRSLKVGDPMTVTTPDGGFMDFIVDRRAWTGVDESQIYLRHGETQNALYGIISRVGPRLTGYFLRRDGKAYALSVAQGGRYELTLRPDHGPNECGVGRVLPGSSEVLFPTTGSFSVTQGEGGIAGGAVTPCPPEVGPIAVPPGLVKDGGILIDILFVFSVDANDAIVSTGSTAYDQAVLTIAQANLALANSTEQPAADFDGQDATNPLNQVCGYGVYPEPGTVVCPPAPLPVAPAPATCASDPINIAYHEARPGVTPAETEVCTPRLRLVGALVCDGFFGQEEPFVSTGFAVDLSRLMTPGDGYLDYVLDWRDALGADEVALIGADYGSDSAFVGLASVMVDANTQAQGMAGLSLPGNPHPVVDATVVDPAGGNLGPSSISTLQAFSESPFCLLDHTILGDTVYAHELGHNFGCQHDHDAPSADPADAIFPDSYGYGDAEFRTVMAYPNGTNVRLPGFSNPNMRWIDYGGPQESTIAAGEEFDFECQDFDGEDGTDSEYIEATGVQCGTATDTCTETGDDLPNTAAAMVIAADVRLTEDGEDTANNSRSISQVKFDFARFRCSIFPITDCNDNLIDDYIEAVDSIAADCDGNSIPDDCETAVEDPGIPSPIDCNQNQIPDGCDISSGESQDVNANGVPDECEDQTLLFRENFETIPFGVQDGLLSIARVSALVLAEIRIEDPTFPDYFATIETVDSFPDQNDGGFIYTDNIPSLYHYGLGRNGSYNEWGGVLGQGFAIAFGSRGYGQRLLFDSLTGDFTSGNGVTTMTLARPTVEARFYLNAADFTEYFEMEELYPGTYPNLANNAYLESNLVSVQAFSVDPGTGTETLRFEQSFDLRLIQTPTYPTGFPTDPDSGGPVRIGQPFGEEYDPNFSFDKIVITGAFVVIDNVSFDLGQVFPDCDGDVAGGIPQGGLPTPDGRVGAEDLVLILAYFGVVPTDPVGDIADINDDGFIDALDLLEVLANYGDCPGGI